MSSASLWCFLSSVGDSQVTETDGLKQEALADPWGAKK